MEKQYRYPGTRPFSEKDRHLFFGRNNDIKQLSELIVLEKLVVLFSKSGYGKSSLLNAGVIPRLTENEKHAVLNIRLNEQERNPLELLIHHLKNNESKTLWLNQKFDIPIELPNELASQFWYYAKNIQLANPGCKSVTLVFDQFEELFNYNNAQIQEFGKTIATLLNLNMPEAVRMLMKQKIKNNAAYFSDPETDQLLDPLNLKVVFSLRNDRLSLLNQLKTFLPAIFKKTYELQPLDEMQALEALLEPAMKEGEFASPTFTYTNAATELILNSLKDKENQRIETFQLQLICQHAEELIIQKAKSTQSGLELTDIELGKPEDIFEKHYKIIIDQLPQNDQHAARILIEDKLIIGGNRVPLPETVITQQHNIAADLLKTLVDKRLLRSEPNTVGGTSYELSHDTLVAPITKAAEVRRQKEEICKLKEKQRKDRRRFAFVTLALVFALTLSAIALWKWIDADKAKNSAEQQKQNAITLLKQELQSKGIIVDNLYEYYNKLALNEFEKGKYVEARNSFNRAKLLMEDKKMQTAINNKLLTIDQIESILKTAGTYNAKKDYNNAIVNYQEIITLNKTDTITYFRIEFAQMLQNGYMVKVEGGTYKMSEEFTVKLSNYHIAKYEVTQRLFEMVMGWNLSEFTDNKQNPVEMVDWYECVEFCNKLSELMGLTPYYSINKNSIDKSNINTYDTKRYTIEIIKGANGFCLPTEAQWQYAASGGNKSQGFTFAGSNEIDEVAWYYDNSGNKTHPVGGKKYNELGIYDMSGNVLEWCWDWYDDYPVNTEDDYVGAKTGSFRVDRGGSWSNIAGNCRGARRDISSANSRYGSIGFRIAISL